MPRFRLRSLARKILPEFAREKLGQWRSRSTNARLRSRDPAAVFTDIYKTREWKGEESASGPGSDLNQTNSVRAQLPLLLKRLGIRSMLDAPCGDFHWMQHVALDGIQYLGGDIVPDVVAENVRKFSRPHVCFERIDITRDQIPRVDLILCRDCLIHLSFEHIRAAISNFKRSGSKYLLTTLYPLKRRNVDIATGNVRSLNLLVAPFNFPKPLHVIDEDPPTGRDADEADLVRCLGLWQLEDLKI